MRQYRGTSTIGSGLAPHRNRYTLCDALARGWFAAGDRGGRRSRDVRAQVSWCRAGAQGAGGGVGGGGDRTPPRPPGARGRARLPRPRARPLGTRPRDTGPPEEKLRVEPGARLPARLSRLRPAGGAAGLRPRLTHRLVRRPGDQRGPHPAQHERPGLAQAPLAHRPRGFTVLPPQLARQGRGGAPSREPASFRRRARPRPAPFRTLHTRSRCGAGPAPHPRGVACDSRPDPRDWLAEEPGFADTEEVRTAYVAYLGGRLREPRAWVHALEEAAR